MHFTISLTLAKYVIIVLSSSCPIRTAELLFSLEKSLLNDFVKKLHKRLYGSHVLYRIVSQKKKILANTNLITYKNIIENKELRRFVEQTSNDIIYLRTGNAVQ